MNKIRNIFNTKRVIVLLVVLLVAGGAVVLGTNGNGEVKTSTIAQGDLIRTVRVSGKVVSSDVANLGFETSGTVSSISKRVGDKVSRGDVLLRLDSSAVSADILRAEAELASARAELAKLDGGSVYETSITNAKRTVAQAIRDAYTAVDDAVFNKTDEAFDNPRGSRPSIIFSYQFSKNIDYINDARKNIGASLEEWKEVISGMPAGSYTSSDLAISKQHLSEAIGYLSELSRILNSLEPDSFITSAEIESFKSAASTARTNVNTANQSLISKEDALNALLLDVPVQAARVSAAEASVQSLRSDLSRLVLTTPISGVISRQDAKLGQAVTPGVSLASVISEDYIIEIFVPEVSIAGIELGNTAKVTLDAYGESAAFTALVTHIDPAETLRDGVSAYRVELTFSETDSRIRSGMTANVEIETYRKEEALLVPLRSVVSEDGKSYVYIELSDGSYERTEVEIGERDSRGNAELISGAETGERILINPKED